MPAEKSAEGIAKVIYTGKTTGTTQEFDAVDWLAKLVTHIPSKGEQLVRYYGRYSNKCRGKLLDENQEVEVSKGAAVGRKKFRKSWARLIQKVYNVNPLICPKCGDEMRIVAFIEEASLIEKILRHLKLWNLSRNKEPPKKSVNEPVEYEYVNDENIELPDYENWY